MFIWLRFVKITDEVVGQNFDDYLELRNLKTHTSLKVLLKN